MFGGMPGTCAHFKERIKSVDRLATKCSRMLGHDYTCRHNEVVNRIYLFFFYLRQRRVNFQKVINRLTIRYFNIVGFLPIKTSPYDYNSARATISLWPWFQEYVIVFSKML